jgi:hypothetical protein
MIGVSLTIPFNVPGCGIAPPTPLFTVFWIPLLINEAILCFLMAWKAWNVYKSRHGSVLFWNIVYDRYVSWMLMLSLCADYESCSFSMLYFFRQVHLFFTCQMRTEYFTFILVFFIVYSSYYSPIASSGSST